MDFEWDADKDVLNQRKHGISFEEARVLFESGDDSLEIFDAEHSESEDRFIAIGPSGNSLIVVVFTESEEGRVRIIGARQSTNRERALYRAHMDRRR